MNQLVIRKEILYIFPNTKSSGKVLNDKKILPDFSLIGHVIQNRTISTGINK